MYPIGVSPLAARPVGQLSIVHFAVNLVDIVVVLRQNARSRLRLHPRLQSKFVIDKKKSAQARAHSFLVYPIGGCPMDKASSVARRYRKVGMKAGSFLARTNAYASFLSKSITPKKPPRKGTAFLVYPIGVEPTTPSVGGWCSIQLSYGYVFSFAKKAIEKDIYILLFFAFFLQAFMLYYF